MCLRREIFEGVRAPESPVDGFESWCHAFALRATRGSQPATSSKPPARGGCRVAPISRATPHSLLARASLSLHVGRVLGPRVVLPELPGRGALHPGLQRQGAVQSSLEGQLYAVPSPPIWARTHSRTPFGRPIKTLAVGCNFRSFSQNALPDASAPHPSSNVSHRATWDNALVSVFFLCSDLSAGIIVDVLYVRRRLPQPWA